MTDCPQPSGFNLRNLCVLIIISSLLLAPRTYADENILCSCVKFARYIVPTLPLGNADVHKPNLDEPEVGQFALFKYKALGHIAVVIEANAETFTIVEANYNNCKFSLRTLPYDYYALKGFYRPLSTPQY